jgi:hypothetical protein
MAVLSTQLSWQPNALHNNPLPQHAQLAVLQAEASAKVTVTGQSGQGCASAKASAKAGGYINCASLLRQYQAAAHRPACNSAGDCLAPMRPVMHS